MRGQSDMETSGSEHDNVADNGRRSTTEQK